MVRRNTQSARPVDNRPGGIVGGRGLFRKGGFYRLPGIIGQPRSGFLSGSLMRNTVPLPGMLFTSMTPLCFLMMP